MTNKLIFIASDPYGSKVEFTFSTRGQGSFIEVTMQSGDRDPVSHDLSRNEFRELLAQVTKWEESL